MKGITGDESRRQAHRLRRFRLFLLTYSLLAVGSPGLWAEGLKERATLRHSSQVVTALAFSPDGKTLATATADPSGKPGEVRLWDVGTGKEVRTLKGHAAAVHNLAFSSDGKTLASASTEDGQVKVWDVGTGKERVRFRAFRGRTLPVPDCVRFTPDDKTLAVGGMDGTLELWDLAGPKQRTTWKAHAGMVYSLSFSPDGKTLASGGSRKDDRDKETGGEIRLWDAATGKERAAFTGFDTPPRLLAFSADGKTLASVRVEWNRPTEVKLWDVPAGKGKDLPGLKDHHVLAVVFVSGDKALLTATMAGQVQRWDVATGTERAALTVDTSGLAPVPIHAAFTADGQVLAAGSIGAEVKVWDVARISGRKADQ